MVGLIKRIWNGYIAHFDARRRHIDMVMLWPSFCRQAPDMEYAQAAFACHVFNDTAWTRHFSEDDLIQFIDELGRNTQHGQ